MNTEFKTLKKHMFEGSTEYRNQLISPMVAAAKRESENSVRSPCFHK